MPVQLTNRRTAYAWLWLIASSGLFDAGDDDLPELVSQCPFPVAVLDLEHRTVAATSGPFLDVVGLHAPEPHAVFDLLVEQPAQVSALIELVRDGSIDAFEAHRTLRHGTGVGVEATMWMIVSEASRERALVVVAADDRDPSVLLPRAAESRWPVRVAGLVVGVIENDWRISRMSVGMDDRLGIGSSDLLDRPLVEALHPDDIPDFLTSVAQAIVGATSVGLPVRLRRDDGSFVSLEMVIAPLANAGAAQYGFALSLPQPSGVRDASRVSDLERRLRAIAWEVEAAGVTAGFSPRPALVSDGRLQGLTPRQWQVLERLLDGRRVPGIARELYVSQSTVRNHLSAIFVRFGVKSQDELISLFADSPDPPSRRR